MAQRKTTSSSKSNSRSGRSSSKTASGSRASRNTRSLPPEPEKEPLLSLIWSYSWGKALYLILGILVLIGLDFLISMNHYDRFFTVLGIEVIVAMITGWIVFLFLDRKRQRDAGESVDSESEE